MEIFEAFTAYLQNHAGLKAIIGAGGVFPDFLPQERKQAAIAYQAIGGDPHSTLDGEDILCSPIYQFSCYGNSNKEAYAVYKQLKAAFKDCTNMSGLVLEDIERLSDPVKDYESDTKRHSYKVDYQFHFNE